MFLFQITAGASKAKTAENVLLQGSKATNYIGADINFALSKDPKGTVLYSAYGSSGYDGGFNGIVASIKCAGIGIAAGADEFEIAGKKWKVVERGNFPKSMTIESEDGQRVVLKDKEPVNLEPATGKNNGWMVRFAQADNAKDLMDNNSGGTKEYAWIYRSGSLDKSRPGDAIEFPTCFGGDITYDGLVNDKKFPVLISALDSGRYDTDKGTLEGPAIRIKTDPGRILIDFIFVGSSSDGFAVTDNLLYFPSNEMNPGMLFTKLEGTGRWVQCAPQAYLIGGAPLEHYDQNTTMPGEDIIVILCARISREIAISEPARPIIGNITNPSDRNKITIPVQTGGDGSYAFGTPAYLDYGQQGEPHTYQSGFYTERGSTVLYEEKECTLNLNRVSENFNNGIAMMQWSVNDAGNATGVDELGTPVPTGFKLYQNYPNPFNPITKIKFSVPEASDVSLKVYDILGREVATLAQGNKAAGNYEVTFNGGDLASGVYLYRLIAGDRAETRKMNLVK